MLMKRTVFTSINKSVTLWMLYCNDFKSPTKISVAWCSTLPKLVKDALPFSVQSLWKSNWDWSWFDSLYLQSQALQKLVGRIGPISLLLFSTTT